MKNLRNTFNSNQNGSISLIFGLLIPVLMILIVGIMNYGKAELAAVRLQNASNIAAIAIKDAPSNSTTAALTNIARNTFILNIPLDANGTTHSFKGITVASNNLTLSVDPITKAVTIKIDQLVPKFIDY